MIAFLAVVASVGALSSVLRLIIAWVDLRKKWAPPASYTWRKK